MRVGHRGGGGRGWEDSGCQPPLCVPHHTVLTLLQLPGRLPSSGMSSAAGCTKERRPAPRFPRRGSFPETSPPPTSRCRAGAAAHDPPVRKLPAVAARPRQLLPLQVGAQPVAMGRAGGDMSSRCCTLMCSRKPPTACTAECPYPRLQSTASPALQLSRAMGLTDTPAARTTIAPRRELGAELECITCDRCACHALVPVHSVRCAQLWIRLRLCSAMPGPVGPSTCLPCSHSLPCPCLAIAPLLPLLSSPCQAVPPAVPALPSCLGRRAARRRLDLPLLRRGAACEWAG